MQVIFQPAVLHMSLECSAASVQVTSGLPSGSLSLSLPLALLPSPSSPTSILLRTVPLEGKTNGLGEVTGIAGERVTGESKKGRGGGREGKGAGKGRGHGKGGRMKR
jgi:hypothetical protein